MRKQERVFWFFVVIVVCLPHDWSEPLESETLEIQKRLKRGKLCWSDAFPEVGRLDGILNTSSVFGPRNEFIHIKKRKSSDCTY